MDHIIAEVNQLPCSTDNCQLCQYRSMNDSRIDSELNGKTDFSFSLLHFNLYLLYRWSKISSINCTTTIIRI